VKPLPSEDLEHILEHTRPLWEEARRCHVFISGGTGFVGTWLAESLAFCNRRLNLGLTATLLTRDPAAFRHKLPHLASEPCLRLLQGDVRSFDFPGDTFELVIHGATSTNLADATRPLELQDIILRGTERILTLAETAGTRRFLFLSSGAVYGPQPETLNQIPEDYRGGPNWLDPNAVYDEGKRIAEQTCLLHAKASGFALAIARCFTFVGPRLPLDQHFAIGNFIADTMAGGGISISGDGTPVRSYLYAADLAIWLWTLLLRSGKPDEDLLVINVGSDEAISIRDLAATVVRVLNPSLRVTVAGESAIGANRRRYVPDIRKAQSVLGLRPLISLDDAIRRTAAWHR
jgi:nucleoside-diphosphate-sugar epimerase